jgi:uroporphyrinogen decarboxylase
MNLDLNKFWENDKKAHKDNCFSEDAPQMALGIRMSGECVFAELNEEGSPWDHTIPVKRRNDLNKRYNDKSEIIVGKRLLKEDYLPEDSHFPYIKRVGEVFGGTYKFEKEGGEWLFSGINSIPELEKQLDIVDNLDLEDFMLPDNWEKEKQRIYETYGLTPNTLRWIRGPVTLASSIFGAENLIFLYYDAKEVFIRFSKSITKVAIKMAEIMDEQAGYTKENAPHGYSFADDDCNLFTAEMYEAFGYPVLKKVFERFSPNAGDTRFQHSDSPMEHLIPILSKLNLTGCNFGPTVTVDKIREYMPNTRIDGCLAPFTFMRNNKDVIKKEVIRDYNMAIESGVKGINLFTAGSINNGSSLESMRYIMELIQNQCRY